MNSFTSISYNNLGKTLGKHWNVLQFCPPMAVTTTKKADRLWIIRQIRQMLHETVNT